MSSEFIHTMSALAKANRFAPVDVEFCRFLAEADPDIHESVLLASCLVSSANRNGDVCIYLDAASNQPLFDDTDTPALKTPELEDWLKHLDESTVVGKPGDFKPLILDNAGRLYLHKRWLHEQELATLIQKKINSQTPAVDVKLLKDGIQRLFQNTEEGTDWQKIATVLSINQLFTVISGGPGTGKTHTVIRLLILLLEQGRKRGKIPDIALAAPTGKAANRLQKSIENIPETLHADEDIISHIPGETVTLHHLLGAQYHTTKFRYHKDNPLPFDCVIVDEASMVDQTLMTRLMQALPPKTRLILLGDKDQLASVEAGSVLGDICGNLSDNKFPQSTDKYFEKLNIDLPEKYFFPTLPKLANHINLLQKSYRFTNKKGLSRLVKAIHSGDANNVWNLLLDDRFPEIEFIPFHNYQMFTNILSQRAIQQFKGVQTASSPDEMLNVHHQFKILGAHRSGPWGVETINLEIEQKLAKRNLIFPAQNWYEGRPVIINTNDYSLGLNNGDMGVCRKQNRHSYSVFFHKKDNNSILPVTRLPKFSPAFALTVHKSQGSEFDEIMVALPGDSSQLLHRELLYTAVSRARQKVTIIGTKEALTKAVNRRIKRHSGLQDYLWKN